MNKKTIYLIISVIIGAIIFGLISTFLFISYGGNNCDQPPENTCDCLCCNMFNQRGYEACAIFGGIIGVIFGIIVGFMIKFILIRKR